MLRVFHWLRTRAETSPLRMAALLGAILPLSFAPFHFFPVFYLAYGAVFWLALIHRGAPRRLFFLGFWFGFGQFFTGLAWMGEAFLVEAERFLWALPFAVTLLPTGLALFPAAAFALFGWLQKGRGQTALAPRGITLGTTLGLLAVLLTLSEYARSTVLTGLPWNLPGMALGGWLIPAQLAAYIGVHGLSLLALLSVALLLNWLMQPQRLAARRHMAWAFGLPILLLALGAARLYAPLAAPAPQDNAALRLAIVQPNIDQREKWQADKRDRHIEKTLTMTRLALDYAPEVDLIIWPESAIPALIDEGPGFSERLRATLKPVAGRLPYLLTGAVRRDVTPDGTAFYNSAMLWSGDGHLLARTDKHHLVPFGEYLPLQDTLEAMGLEQLARLRGGYASGAAHGRLTAARLPVLAPLICYEAIFPALSGGAGLAPRPAALVNLTNDGWFGQWHGPHQHFAQARLRAIEQGLPLLRAANTGISAVFDAQGHLLDAVPLGTAGTLSLSLPPALPPTFYHHYGDLGFWLLWGLVACVLMVAAYRRA